MVRNHHHWRQALLREHFVKQLPYARAAPSKIRCRRYSIDPSVPYFGVTGNIGDWLRWWRLVRSRKPSSALPLAGEWRTLAKLNYCSGVRCRCCVASKRRCYGDNDATAREGISIGLGGTVPGPGRCILSVTVTLGRRRR